MENLVSRHQCLFKENAEKIKKKDKKWSMVWKKGFGNHLCWKKKSKLEYISEGQSSPLELGKPQVSYSRLIKKKVPWATKNKVTFNYLSPLKTWIIFCYIIFLFRKGNQIFILFKKRIFFSFYFGSIRNFPSLLHIPKCNKKIRLA